MIRNINIAPVKFSNVTMLSRVVSELQKKFTCSVNIIELMLDLDLSFYAERLQYYSTQILSDAIKLTDNHDGKTLILTEVDLFIPVFTFVFGEAQLKGDHSVVSVCRLHEEFYSGTSNDELLFERTMKEVLHELGHNFGLRHCDDWDCVMHSSPGIEEVDIKGGAYCSRCGDAIEAYRA